GGSLAHHARKLLQPFHFLSVVFGDYVALFESRLLRGAIGIHACDLDAGLFAEPQSLSAIRIHFLNANAQEARAAATDHDRCWRGRGRRRWSRLSKRGRRRKSRRNPYHPSNSL